MPNPNDRSVVHGIVQPVITRNTPKLGPLALMAATRIDLDDIVHLLGPDQVTPMRLYMSQLVVAGDHVAIAGPMMGAPYAAMILETLIAWGAREILFLGWCGAISPDIGIGDILIPSGAWIDEGTSAHYRLHESPSDNPWPHHPDYMPVQPTILAQEMKQILETAAIPFHEGSIWTTDAIYRETPEKIACFQKKNAIGVEMELSALLSVARFRNVNLAAMLVVSDSVSGSAWKPGFRDQRFQSSRRLATNIMGQICQNPRMRTSVSGLTG